MLGILHPFSSMYFDMMIKRVHRTLHIYVDSFCIKGQRQCNRTITIVAKQRDGKQEAGRFIEWTSTLAEEVEVSDVSCASLLLSLSLTPSHSLQQL